LGWLDTGFSENVEVTVSSPGCSPGVLDLPVIDVLDESSFVVTVSNSEDTVIKV